ncbi:hypothetical protein H0H81_004145 [Sphagnurus paluster]|uniref:PBP domain-containing protein n=1 Tax=Sphagnurus paluster TaxID=117069 RepID=A0A9P7FSZ0_9AGAR|nr:hypothetical protein H0H81_004145 [Sphagnurus paluster]
MSAANQPSNTTPEATASNSGPQPRATYNGGYPEATEIRLRIANGGAGQSGLIGAWADAFIQHCVKNLGWKPFKVGWYLGDTTESLGFLANGFVDVAVTYNKAAEMQLVQSQLAKMREYGFRSPPDPAKREAIRFLSRFDKSATNIKESELFITIGQVPWALVYSKWYHQYPRFPLQALEAASALSEYTLTDRGTWLSSPSEITSKLEIFKAGSDDATDPLLNPAHVLLGAHADQVNAEVWLVFMGWVMSKDGGQKIIREFKKFGEVLYSEAPAA